MNGAMNSVCVVLCLCSGIIAVFGEVCQVERVSGAFEHKEYNGNYIRQDITSAEEDVSSDKIYHVYIYQKNKMMFCAEGKWYIGPIPNDPDSAVLKSKETYSNWPHTVHEWFEQSSLDIWRINPDITVDCTTAGGGLSTAWIVLITMAVILVVILSLFGLIYVCKPPGRPTTGGRNTVPAADNRNDTAQASFGMERPRTPPPPYSGKTETRSNIPLTSLQAATVQNVDLSHNNYKTGPPSNAVEVRDPCTGTEGAACPSISAKNVNGKLQTEQRQHVDATDSFDAQSDNNEDEHGFGKENYNNGIREAKEACYDGMRPQRSLNHSYDNQFDKNRDEHGFGKENYNNGIREANEACNDGMRPQRSLNYEQCSSGSPNPFYHSAKPTAPNKDSSMSQTYNAKLGTGQHATSEHGDN